MNETDKEAVYPLFQQKEKVVIFDRGYFANQWVSAVNQDFYLILYISSFLIFTDSDEFPADAGQLDYHCGINGHTGY